MIGRRRFLTIMAAAAASTGSVGATEWRGRALGADARILIRGGAVSARIIAAVRAEIERIEQVFSLYRESELVRLNRKSRGRVSADLAAALTLARNVHEATDGAFDPAVQLLWQGLAQPAGKTASTGLLAFAGLRQNGRRVRLESGQALTFNGLAQGLAADRVAALLTKHELDETLVDMGENKAIGTDFKLALADSRAGSLGRITLRAGRAIATSSPDALRFPGGQSHILGPQGQVPRWSSVSVEAGSAALADAASTGFVLMDRDAIGRAARRLGVGPVRLVDFEGNLTTL